MCTTAPRNHAKTARRPAIEPRHTGAGLKIVADERVAALDEAFARHGDVVRMPGRSIDRNALVDADALITRTVTPVNRALLEGTAVRFVGTASIGADHIDIPWLESQGIHWTSAPGCNAVTTSEHTLAMFLLAFQRLGRNPRNLRFGIVGLGNVGSRLQVLLHKLGVETIACDPPLAAQGQPGLSEMQDIYDCDVISLHVPLTRDGQWPTWRMFNEQAFDALGTDTLLINACRGDVIDADALKAWQAHGGHAALDVWPGEPEIDTQVLENTLVATPHIAGYSLDGKFRASAMVYQAFCNCFDFEPGQLPRAPAPTKAPHLDPSAETFVESFLQALPVERDDGEMRNLLALPASERSAGFEALRANYPLRRDLNL